MSALRTQVLKVTYVVLSFFYVVTACAVFLEALAAIPRRRLRPVRDGLREVGFRAARRRGRSVRARAGMAASHCRVPECTPSNTQLSLQTNYQVFRCIICVM